MLELGGGTLFVVPCLRIGIEEVGSTSANVKLGSEEENRILRGFSELSG